MAQSIITVLPSVLWFLFACVLVTVFRKRVMEIAESVAWRVRAGAGLKLSVFEVGALQINPLTKVPINKEQVSKDDGEFHASRQEQRDAGLFIVHRLGPSTEADQLYDVLIYLVPSLRFGTLLNVVSVDCYFGRYWDGNIYTSTDRAKAFSISTSAYAPFSCTARVRYNDGHQRMLHRFIDFEMGPLGPLPKPPDGKS